jgi:hypothetical protein
LPSFFSERGGCFGDVDQVFTPFGFGQMLEEVDEFLKGGGHGMNDE